MTGRLRSALAHLALAVVPVFLLLLLLEWGVRLTGAAESCPNRFSRGGGIWVCDPILHFKLDPSFEPYGQPLNALGFRGPLPGPKRSGTLRVLALGDSCTFGYIGRDTGVGSVFQPYPLKLQRFAERRVGPDSLEVLNAGVPGYNSHHGILLLRSKLRRFEPDLVTVRYGWNDHFLSAEGESELFREPDSRLGLLVEDLLLRSKLYAFVRRLGLELRALREPVDAQARRAFFTERGYTPTIPIERYERNLRRIVELGRGMGAGVWLLTAPRNPHASPEARETQARRNKLDFDELMRIHDEYNEVVRRVGAELGARVVDMAAVYRQYEGEPVFLPTDVVHPAQGGQNLEAELLFRALRSEGLLPDRARPR